MAANTVLSEGAARRYWSAWYRLRYGKATLPMPVPADVIVRFIVEHGRRTVPKRRGHLTTEMPPEVDAELVRLGVKKKPGHLSLATVVQRVSMIGRMNRPFLRGKRNPVAHPDVRELIAGLRLAYAKRSAAESKKQPALTSGPLQEMVRALEKEMTEAHDTWTYRRAIRDRALILFAFSSGGRRRSEVASASMERLKANRDGSYVYTLGATKSATGKRTDDDEGRPIEDAAADAMRVWLQEAQIRSGPIFRRVGRGGRIAEEGLAPESIRYLVVRLSKKADLPERYSAHSLRSGFITEAVQQGVPMEEVMAFSGHRNVQTAMRYYRAQNKRDSPAAHLYDGKIKTPRKRSTG